VSELTRDLESAIAEQHLLSPGEPVLVGVSGGLDSMVLLHVLHRLARTHGWQLVIGHFNHQLRGQSSDADERFVRAAGRELKIPVRTGRGNVRVWALRQGLSIEMAARYLRHRFLARTAATLGIQKLALAHHADDQIELFFLRLLRGTSLAGLSGMEALGASPVGPAVQIIRPLLGVGRADLEACAQEQGIEFRHDTSNDSPQFERNRIRHELLPFLRAKFQPALSKTILRLITILSDESDFVAQQTEHALDQEMPFEQLPRALQRRWIASEALALGIVPDFERIEHWRRHAGEELMLNPDLVVWRDEAGHLQSRNPTRPSFRHGQLRVQLLSAKGRVTFAGVRCGWAIGRWRGWEAALEDAQADIHWFDAGKIGKSIRLRHWRSGDRFQPIGMKRSVKVQDLFTNLKIPRPLRMERVLAETAEGEIFWIEGLRISERFKIDESTSRALQWSWKRNA
jgi:tRNA(Ile)-lysidine synthase